MNLKKLRELAVLAAQRTPGEWGKGEGYYGNIGTQDGRYFCELHNNILALLDLVELQHKALQVGTSRSSSQAIKAYNKFNQEDV
jgi:hypothetical protein